MSNHDQSLNSTKANRLRLIREFVELQQAIVREAVSRMAPTATKYDFEDSLPDTITVGGGRWLTSVHGMGVMFTNQDTGVVVDVHIGLFDAPHAFDAWRLIQYSESIHRSREEYHSWQRTLDELCREGVIEPHVTWDRHYCMT